MHAKAILPKVKKALVSCYLVSLDTLSGLDSSLDYLIADELDADESGLTIDEGRLLTLLLYSLSSS